MVIVKNLANLSQSNLGVSLGLLLEKFRKVCTVSAGLRSLSGALASATGAGGRTYWHVAFDVCIRFGGTELEAYLEWKEKVNYVQYRVLRVYSTYSLTGNHPHGSSDYYS